MADLDVVVVNHRTPGDLAAFLDSLDSHAPTAVDVDVRIANVAPDIEDIDVTERWLASTSLPAQSHVFVNNVGYARACNTLAGLGDAQVIALFNADIRLTAGALDQCVGALRARPDWATLGPRQVDSYGRLVHGGIFGGEAQPAHRGWRSVGNWHTDIRDDAVFVAGSAIFIRRSVWNELAECPIVTAAYPRLGGAMPTFALLYYEDTWLGVHARAHGYKNAYFGACTVTHGFHRSVKANLKHGTDKPIMSAAHDRFRELCEAHSIEHD